MTAYENPSAGYNNNPAKQSYHGSGHAVGLYQTLLIPLFLAIIPLALVLGAVASFSLTSAINIVNNPIAISQQQQIQNNNNNIIDLIITILNNNTFCCTTTTTTTTTTPKPPPPPLGQRRSSTNEETKTLIGQNNRPMPIKIISKTNRTL